MMSRSIKYSVVVCLLSDVLHGVQELLQSGVEHRRVGNIRLYTLRIKL